MGKDTVKLLNDLEWNLRARLGRLEIIKTNNLIELHEIIENIVVEEIEKIKRLII